MNTLASFSLCRARWVVLAALYPAFGSAGSYFNPAFLSSDAANVADLSRFEKGNNQPPAFIAWMSGVMTSSLAARMCVSS